jgi:glycosyltransferase involved in cell wall biosynthesis
LEDLNDDEVVEKILFLLNNPNIFQKIASTLFKEVENYSWQEYSKKTFD